MIKSRITLKQLEALVYVADMGTFRKAAAALGTTQPNVSVRIASMENMLDVVLMHRDAGSIELTEKGKEILAAARTVLQGAEALLEVAQRRDLIEERLRLGVTELIASTWLHRFLRELKQTYPALRVELSVDISTETNHQLVAGELDLALMSDPFKGSFSGAIRLDSYGYGWFAVPELATHLPAQPDVTDLLQSGILTHAKQTLAPAALRQVLIKHGLTTEEIMYSSSLAACRNMAVDGMGIALLPRQLLRDDMAAGKVVEIHCAWLPKPLQFFARFDHRRAPRFVSEAANLASKVAGDFRK